MLFAKVIATASLVATAIAQSSTRIAFTILPSTMEAGKDITLHWGGGDSSPVTLTLQQGTTDDLKTVQLVTGSATGTSYTWKVPSNLPDATNYAFRIQQGDTEPNYTGMITLVGGATGTVSSATASATSASSSASASSSSEKGGVIGGGSSSNSTASSSGNSTSTATSTGKAAIGSASQATGTTMHRNTTMSKATLSSSSAATSTAAATTTTSEGSGSGSQTGASTAPSASKTGAASNLAGNLALVVFAFAGVAYLA